MPPIRIPPSEYSHKEISCETCEHYEHEFFCMDESCKKSCIHEYHAKCEEFPTRIRDDRKLSLEYWLEVAHQWAIHEAEEGKKWCDRYTDHRFWTIVPIEKVSDPEWEYDDTSTRKRAKREDIRWYFIHHFLIILMRWELADCDRIESEISDDGEYGEVVIYLRVEPVSLDIEVSCEDLDHPDRDDRCEDFSTYLGESVGIDFLGGHRETFSRVYPEIREKEIKKSQPERGCEEVLLKQNNVPSCFHLSLLIYVRWCLRTNETQ